MANVFDVAQYILKKSGTLTTMKLQKLLYYSQAWSLAWDGVPLFKRSLKHGQMDRFAEIYIIFTREFFHSLKFKREMRRS